MAEAQLRRGASVAVVCGETVSNCQSRHNVPTGQRRGGKQAGLEGASYLVNTQDGSWVEYSFDTMMVNSPYSMRAMEYRDGRVFVRFLNDDGFEWKQADKDVQDAFAQWCASLVDP